ncbi:MAG: NAD-dependent epimerase/dehydratase family protein [Hylemonella sp.]|nr:NAD-dependent epimerase/dehydratase family protein [Hylemonella sp.]
MLPRRFSSVEELEDTMTTPSAALVDTLKNLPGDIMVLGVGGKMGPTLARMAKRAAPGKRIIGVARFSELGLQQALQSHGIECITADLSSREELARLPDIPNIVFMAGRKFGSSGSEWLTWAMNAYVPALVAERFSQSRIVTFSTACVYPFVDVTSGGASESAPLTPPPGEYANSCVARERLFQHFSHQLGTPGRFLRLSYAIDMRYGVLHDIGKKLIAGEPIDLSMGHANIIWQGDANDWALRTLAHCTAPASGLNISGPPILIRDAATALASRLGVQPIFTGTEAPTAWLVNIDEALRLFGPPHVPLDTLLDWTADWISRDMASLGKPTHYEARDGRY